MTELQWKKSPVFYVLLVVLTVILYLLHGPVLSWWEGWSDSHFQAGSMSRSMSWIHSDSDANILEYLLKAVLALIVGLLIIIFGLFVIACEFLWKHYVLQPVIGAALAYAITYVIEWRREHAYVESSALVRNQKEAYNDRFSAMPRSGVPRTPTDDELLRRRRVDAWLRSRDDELRATNEEERPRE